MSIDLWTEKFRPTTLDEYVWESPLQRKQAEEWIAAGALPQHYLFSGPPGIGKTSLALLLMRALNVPMADVLKIPASRERKIDEIQAQVLAHCQTIAWGESGIKYVILDEADQLSAHAQKLLRNEMEEYAEFCRFILTCNYPNRIIEAVHSRVQHIRFKALDREEFTVRLGEIVTREGVTFEIDNLLAVVETAYPDLRKAINLAQGLTVGGVLHAPSGEAEVTKDYLIEMVALMAAGRTTEARRTVVKNAQVEEYVDIYKFFYRNPELWGDTDDAQERALIEIRDGLVNHTLVADPEINLAATMVTLCRIARGV
jgi:replication factor C small subunit